LEKVQVLMAVYEAMRSGQRLLLNIVTSHDATIEFSAE
jgi:hypothetical protein